MDEDSDTPLAFLRKNLYKANATEYDELIKHQWSHLRLINAPAGDPEPERRGKRRPRGRARAQGKVRQCQ